MKIPFFISRERRLLLERFERFGSKDSRGENRPESSELNYFRQGREAFQRGDYKNADAFLSTAIEKNRMDASFFYLRAVIRHALCDPQKDAMADVAEGARLESQENEDAFAQSFGTLFENVQGKHRLWLEDQRLLAKACLVRRRKGRDVETVGRELMFSSGALERERQNLLSDPEAIRCLKSCLNHQKYYSLENLLYCDLAIVFNFRYVKSDTIKKYFQSHMDEKVRAKMGPKMNNLRILTNWRMTVARNLFLEGYRGDEIGDDLIVRTCEKICKVREMFGDIEFFTGYVVYVAGDGKIRDCVAFQSEDPKVLKKRDNIIKIAGEYQFGIRPVERGFKERMGENFKFVRVEREDSERAREEIFHAIRTQKSPLRLILDGHADADYFYPSISGKAAFSVDQLVDAFVARYRGPYGEKIRKKYTHETRSYLPIGVAQEEFGQEVNTNLELFKDVLKIGKNEKITISDLVSFDEGEHASSNLFLAVPDVSAISADMDMIFFILCEGPDFQSNFYRKLREKMGGKSYIPIARRDDVQKKRGQTFG